MPLEESNPAPGLLAAFEDLLALFQTKVKAYPALMGDGAGVVNVPLRTGWVYVRMSGSDSVVSAYNDRVPIINDMPILVGYEPFAPTLFQVLGIRHVYNSVSSVPKVPAHHKTHEWLVADGGNDVVFSLARQLMPLRVSASGMVLTVYASPYKTESGWKEITGTLNLNAYVPGSGACWALVSLTSTGVLAVVTGTVKASRTLLLVTDIPALPSGNYPLAGVVLYFGQTAIVETSTTQDILDLRFAGAGGSGDVAGAVDAPYLREQMFFYS